MRHPAAGFTLIELGIGLVIFGLLVALTAPAIGRFTDDLTLKGTVDQMANALLLTRDRATATRVSRTIQFQAGVSGYDYRVEVDGVVQTGWKLPRGVTYAWLPGTINSATMTPDGRCDASGLIILQNTRGNRDTVSVLSSGLVLTK